MGNDITISEAAERVLFSSSLKEKLEIMPSGLVDKGLSRGVTTPDAPGRPAELVLQDTAKVAFPKITQIHRSEERGIMLHFLANHELLAAELMALVLLKFPDAPSAYRRGVYEAMREEQMHTKMYLRRMKDCGVQFGALPINDYFWRMVSPMESPLEFVSKLNLTFEQANLDFSKYYAEKFREAGDSATANVLDKIYRDEIDHVGHGLHWFREWKSPNKQDWDAYSESLSFPLSPARAKGLGLFNREGRKLAGLDDGFIDALETYQQSRGRTPDVFWFNPHAEEYVAAQVSGKTFQPKKLQAHLESDLELIMMSLCHPDDILLLRKLPSRQHLKVLHEAGLPICQTLLIDLLDERKIGGLQPWAWSPDASKTLETFSPQVTKNSSRKWREPYEAKLFSKELALPYQEGSSMFVQGLEESQWAIDETGLPLIMKTLYGCSGRGHTRILKGESPESSSMWRGKQIRRGGLVIEPLYNRVLDFSILYQKEGNDVNLLGMTRGLYTQNGQYQGSQVTLKWGNLFPLEIRTFLFQECRFEHYYKEVLTEQLSEQFSDYSGPIAIDAFVYKEGDLLKLRQVVEINLRYSMGRVAHALMQRTGKGGIFQIVKKEDPRPESTIPLNDPSHAESYIATWAFE